MKRIQNRTQKHIEALTPPLWWGDAPKTPQRKEVIKNQIRHTIQNPKDNRATRNQIQSQKPGTKTEQHLLFTEKENPLGGFRSGKRD